MMTAIDRDCLPTTADIAFFREHGWWLSPPLFSDAELDRAIALQDRYYAGEHAQLPESWPWDRSSGIPEDPAALRKNDYSSILMPALQLISHKPVLGACAAALMGSDQVRLWHDQLLYKPPRPQGRTVSGQTAVGWHADRNYWRTCTGPLLTAWVPFTDITPDMGPIAFLDKSQDWELLEELDFFSDDLIGQEAIMSTNGKVVQKIVPSYRRGQVSFHDWRTVHGSTPNTSDRPRRSMAVHLQAGDNRWWSRARPDGSLHGHANDHLVRRDAAGNPDYTDPEWCPQLWPRD
ncbi:MAG: phytanoyl-CoA dioxygenase family protein [Planctomycetota bacterium]